MVVMGRVMGPYGISGWVRVFPYTEFMDSLADYPAWWLGKGNGSWRELKVNDCAIHGKTLIASLEQYADRDKAIELKGLEIAIPRSQLPVLSQSGDEGYYWADLIGLEVVNVEGEYLGKITGLLETGANDVLQLQSQEQGQETRERLIPFISRVIVEVDLNASRVTVDWGLDY